MTEFDIASDIMNLVTSNEGVTNSRLRLEQIMLDVDSMRMRLISEADRNLIFQKPYQGFSQGIKKLKVLRTTDRQLYVELPKIYTDQQGRPSIGYIGGTDRKSPYRITTGMHNTEHDEFISAYPTVHYSEGLVRLKNATADYISIYDTVFEDPSALDAFGEYDFERTSYPLPEAMIDLLIGKVAEGYLRTMYRKVPQPNTQTDLPMGAGATGRKR